MSAEDVHIPFLSIEPFFSTQYENYQTTSSPNVRASETEVQACNPHSSDFHSKDISVLPVEAYIAALGNNYTSSALTSASYCNTSLPINTWASEPPAGFNPYLAGAIYPPPTPAHRVSIPSTTSSDGLDPTSPSSWQFNAGPLIQTDLGITWWYDPWPSTGRGDRTTLPSRVNDGNTTTDKHKTERTSVSDAKTDSDSPEPARKKKKPNCRGSYQETSSNSNASALTVDLPYSSGSATAPMPLDPDVSFEPVYTEAQTSPPRRRSSRTPGTRSNSPRARQSPPPAAPRPVQRVRNRIAANKCRTKTKAAVAELEATAKAESLRHEQLSVALRSLQAEVFALKSEILTHGACGDGLIQDYLNGSARSWAAGCGGLVEWGPDQASRVPSPGFMQLRS